MKHIPLRTHEKEQSITTISLIKAVLDTTPEGGFKGTSEMRRRFKVEDKVDALHADLTVLELEDDEAKTLLQATLVMPWGKKDRFIMEFEDSLK